MISSDKLNVQYLLPQKVDRFGLVKVNSHMNCIYYAIKNLGSNHRKIYVFNALTHERE